MRLSYIPFQLVLMAMALLGTSCDLQQETTDTGSQVNDHSTLGVAKRPTSIASVTTPGLEEEADTLERNSTTNLETSLHKPSTGSYQVFETLLSHPVRQGLFMRDVPELNAETESRLIREYNEITNINKKANLWQVLGMRGGAESVKVLTNALLSEFNGVLLNESAAARLKAIPYFLGITSQREASALDFLLQGTNPEFWDLCASLDKIGSNSRTEAAKCVIGLLAFNRSVEVAELLAFLRRNPSIVAAWDLRGAVLSGLFERTVIGSLGLEEAYDTVLHSGDFDRRMSAYYHWRETSAVYRQWKEWNEEVRELENSGRDQSINEELTE